MVERTSVTKPIIEKTKYGATILSEPKIFRLKEPYFNWLKKGYLVIALSEETQFYNTMPLEIDGFRNEEEFLINLIKDYPHGNHPVHKEMLLVVSKEEEARGLKLLSELRKKAVLQAI